MGTVLLKGEEYIAWHADIPSFQLPNSADFLRTR